MTATKAKRNPRWNNDEIILALDLYFRLNGKAEDDSNPEVKMLSDRLQLLSPVESKIYEKFRNTNAVTLKLQNLRHYDPERSGGMPGGGKLDGEILLRYYNDREQLHALANSIIRSLDYKLPESPLNNDEDASALEGRRLERLHTYLERNKKLVAKKKAAEMAKHGKLACAACEFDFQHFYGPLGHDFIECHHKVPLSQLGKAVFTRLDDYLLLCANCHRMIHKIKNCDLEVLKKAISVAKT
ncbi:MAG: HNH endonuclease [Bacteroidetes bacterium]|nr:HNH endonuclease [Bacteroidota bacterium]